MVTAAAMGQERRESGAWEQELRAAKKTALLQGGRRRVHYSFEDAREMIEEYDVITELLMLRRWRVRSMLGAPRAWETEPVCVRGETREELWWRVRNVPYPPHVFSVCVDSTNNNLVISTSNHKYYKRLSIPDLDRLELPLDPEAVSFSHNNHTLIVKYQKPARLLDHEKRVRREICTLSSEGNTEDKPQCNTQ
uniref:Protein DPCD n=1 Tax=Petromyzon marinus TaxID=7757 RepID=A0AAJ7TRK0_PETMA|nr:protein DPCD isoform X2 [Petromyzon marinus]